LFGCRRRPGSANLCNAIFGGIKLLEGSPAATLGLHLSLRMAAAAEIFRTQTALPLAQTAGDP
jgi:hypothetical protein